MKWTGDPNWNYIFDGRFYTKEDLKWMGASESPGEILKTPEDWDASIKKLSEKTDRYTCIYEPVKWERNDVLKKIYENIHPENASNTFYCNGDLRLEQNHEKLLKTYNFDFRINVYTFPWIPIQSWIWRDKKYTEKSGMKGCFGDTYIKHAKLDYHKKYKIVCPVNHPKINRVMTLGKFAQHHEFAYSFKNTDTVNIDGSFNDDEFWYYLTHDIECRDKKKWSWSKDGNYIEGDDFVLPVDHGIKFPINDFDISTQKSLTDILQVPSVWPEDLQENDYHNYFPTLEWLQSHIELIHETYCVNSGVFSEKTAKVIGLQKPFLTIGCQNWYKHFKSFGFKLYDELFDYTFDSMPSYKDRWENIMQQCENILETSHDELSDKIEKIQPKLDHNKEVMKSIGRSYMNRVVDAWLLANRILSLSFGFANDKK